MTELTAVLTGKDGHGNIRLKDVFTNIAIESSCYPGTCGLLSYDLSMTKRQKRQEAPLSNAYRINLQPFELQQNQVITSTITTTYV